MNIWDSLPDTNPQVPREDLQKDAPEDKRCIWYKKGDCDGMCCEECDSWEIEV